MADLKMKLIDLMFEEVETDNQYDVAFVGRTWRFFLFKKTNPVNIMELENTFENCITPGPMALYKGDLPGKIEHMSIYLHPAPIMPNLSNATLTLVRIGPFQAFETKQESYQNILSDRIIQALNGEDIDALYQEHTGSYIRFVTEKTEDKTIPWDPVTKVTLHIGFDG